MKNLNHYKARGKQFLGPLTTPHENGLISTGVMIELAEALEKLDANLLAEKIAGEIDIDLLASKIAKAVKTSVTKK